MLALLAMVPASHGQNGVTRQPYLQLPAPTAITVRWRTQSEERGRVWYGSEPGMLLSFVEEASSKTEHEVRITGLQPNTRYYYGVGNVDGIHSGNDAGTHFRTAPETGRATPTRIWAFGDAGRGNEGQLLTRDAYYAFPGAQETDILLLLGDNAYDTGEDWEYQERLFNVYDAMMRKVHTWPAIGNHETVFLATHDPERPHYRNFSLPMAAECGGTPSGTEQWYSFDHGNIHFICLDSMTANRGPNGAMAAWLAADIASTNARWIIAYWHHPPYTLAGYNSDFDWFEGAEMRKNIVPILEANGVDLVLGGHDHIYERSWFMSGHYGPSTSFIQSMKKNPGLGRPGSAEGPYIKNVNVTESNQGTVYIVAGAAATVYAGPFPHPALPVGTNELGTGVIDIQGNQLNFSYLTHQGLIADTFTIIKPYGTTDTDADGLPNDYEVEYGLDPANPADGPLDSDGDGSANSAEFLGGTDPQNAASRLSTALEQAGGAYRVRFPSRPGYLYTVQRSDTIPSNQWTDIASDLPGTGQEITVSDPSPGQDGKRFYRVQVRAR